MAAGKYLYRACLLLLFLACAYDIYIFRNDMALFSMDGAFQTYNAVHAFGRLERVGIDFQSYLGVVMPIFLLPFYIILGKSFFASTAASVAGIWLAILGSVVALGRFSRIPKAFAFPVAAFVFILIGIVPKLHQELLLPGLSLRPLRWSLPYLLAFGAYPLFKRLIVATDRGAFCLGIPVLLGGLGGVALLWSNDLGVPTLIALQGCLFLLLSLRQGIGRALGALALSVSTALGVAYLLITLLSGNHFPEWFRYNYIDIVADQYWLFAPWDEPKRIFSVFDLWKIFVNGKGASGILLVTLILVCLKLVRDIIVQRAASPIEITQLFMYAAAIGGALLPQIGGHVAMRYLPGAALALPFAITVLLPTGHAHRFAAARARLEHIADRSHGMLPVLTIGAALLLHAALFWQTRTVLGQHAAAGYHPIGSSGELGAGPPVFIPELGVRTRDKQADAVRIFAAARPSFAFWPSRQRIFSDYYSAVNIVAGADQSSSLPTVIHALGERQRAKFREDLLHNRPPIATTLRPRPGQPWEAWNFRTSWPFYRTLIENYEPFAASSHHLFWRRRIHALPRPIPLPCDCLGIGNGRARIGIFTRDPRLGPRTWFTDLRTDFGPTRTEPRYRSVYEIAGPPLDAVRKPEMLSELKGYGLSKAQRQDMMMEIRAGEPNVLQVMSLPVRNRYGKPAGRCTAAAILPDPFHASWPVLSRPMLERVLQEEKRREGNIRTPLVRHSGQN